MKDSHLIALLCVLATLGVCVGGWVVLHQNKAAAPAAAPVVVAGAPVTPNKTTDTAAPVSQPAVDESQQRAAIEAARREAVAEAARRAESARLAAQQAADEKLRKENEAKARLVGSVRGAAWLVRNNGSSDLLRSLHVYVISDTVSGADVGKILQGQIEYENTEAKRDREIANEFGADIGRSYVESAAKHDQNAADLRAQIAQLPNSMETMSAYKLCDKLASMMSFRPCALSVQQIEGKTGIDGKYVIANIPGGKYYLYATINTQVLSATWLIPISVQGSELTVDLDNDSAAHLSGG